MADYYYDRKGYRRFSDSGTLVHRWVTEKKLGRSLSSREVVHHIDRNKRNNSPDNLWAFRNRKAHNKVHREDDWY